MYLLSFSFSTGIENILVLFTVREKQTVLQINDGVRSGAK